MRAKAKARAKRASKPPQAATRVSELTTFLDQQNRAWQKIEALMVALEFAANHEAEFDVSDGLAGVITLIGKSLTALDTLEVRHGNSAALRWPAAFDSAALPDLIIC